MLYPLDMLTKLDPFQYVLFEYTDEKIENISLNNNHPIVENTTDLL